jgi:hypothetical protein
MTSECPAHPGNLTPGCRWCRTGITDDTRGRLVVRVSDAAPGALTPAAVVEACAVCRQPVYVDRAATPDPPGETLTLVCTVCGLEDPGTREQVLSMMAVAARFGSALPPAEGPRRRPGGNPVAGKRED